ncbi:MAG: acetylxylan esterase, partial [Candidatus Helarchaeota archaeon]|nr:acetylxylan esterase [Candidatus Helarchaeota archaeon]
MHKKMKNLKFLLILSIIAILSASSVSLLKQENQDDKWKVLQFPYENMMDDHFRRLVDEFNINKKLPQNKLEFKEYKNKIINNLWKSFGWKPNKKTDLQAQITGKTDMGDYIIEKLLFQSIPGMYVTANVFVPKNITSPVPAIVCPHGHWEYGRYQPQVQSRGIGLAKLGYIALMLDAYGFGERKYTGHRNAYLLKPTGITLEGLQIWDNMRAVDYLLTRDDVDPKKIGITGASGGGNQTMYTGLLEPRIKVVVPVASISTLKGLFFRGIGCVCETTPNILRYADLWDITAATAPKPLLYINTVLDPIFPISAGRESYFETKKIYNTIREGEKVKKVEVFAKHDYNKSMREAMYGWFDHWFKNKSGFRTEEPEFSTLPIDAEAFKVLSNGVELKSPETLLSLNYKIAKNLPPKTEIKNKKDLERHKTTLRNKLINEIFGGFPLEKPYEARIIRKIEEDN